MSYPSRPRPYRSRPIPEQSPSDEVGEDSRKRRSAEENTNDIKNPNTGPPSLCLVFLPGNDLASRTGQSGIRPFRNPEVARTKIRVCHGQLEFLSKNRLRCKNVDYQLGQGVPGLKVSILVEDS